MTNQQLAEHLRDFLTRWPSLCSQWRVGDQIDGDIDNIQEAADRLAGEPSADAREDRAYYNGARQAAAMAHQSLDAMDDWIESGCGGRGPVVNRQAEQSGNCTCGILWNSRHKGRAHMNGCPALTGSVAHERL